MGEGVGERSHRALVHDSQGRRDIFCMDNYTA